MRVYGQFLEMKEFTTGIPPGSLMFIIGTLNDLEKTFAYGIRKFTDASELFRGY